MRQKLSQNPVIKLLASDRITVVCLFLLFVLTFWGTIAQVEHGLYPAQERFFSSIVFLVWNFIPFPGARLVLWVFFINLILVSLFRFEYNRKHTGILVMHGGILLLLISAFVTFHFSRESHLSLFENEGANVTASYYDWEFAVWKGQEDKKDVIAYDVKHFKAGQILSFDEFPFTAAVKNYFPNAKAYVNDDILADKEVLNASGITAIKKTEAFLNPEKNTPGLSLLLKTDSDAVELLLFGEEIQPTPVDVGGEKYFFQLRYKRFVLPFLVRLVDFRMEQHPGTEMAKSYESTVEVDTPQMARETVISMNNPLRYRDYTFYQASYAIDQLGREQSTLAVVKNMGRVLPYVATLVTFLGLLVHFIFMVRSHVANGRA